MVNEIKRKEGDNLGSIIEFKFAYTKGVESIENTSNGAVHTNIVFKNNYSWVNVEAITETMQYQETPQESDHGIYYKKRFVAKIAKDRAELIDLFNAIKNEKFIVLYKDANGLQKLVGTIDEPLFLKVNFDTKQQVAGRNEYDIAFEGDGLDKSPEYNV